jgi:hypothetical protein
MDMPTFREDTCRRKVELFESLVSHGTTLSASQRAQLRDEVLELRDSVEPARLVLGGAALGLGAAVLPVVGAITGPVVGGVWAALQAKKLHPYRERLDRIVRDLDRAEVV